KRARSPYLHGRDMVGVATGASFGRGERAFLSGHYFAAEVTSPAGYRWGRRRSHHRCDLNAQVSQFLPPLWPSCAEPTARYSLGIVIVRSWNSFSISSISCSILRATLLLVCSRTATPTTTRPAFRREWLLIPEQSHQELC